MDPEPSKDRDGSPGQIRRDSSSEFLIQNVIKKPGCETFQIDFHDHDQPSRNRDRSCHQLLQSRLGSRSSKSSRTRPDNLISPSHDQRKVEKALPGWSQLRKQEKNEINSSLRSKSFTKFLLIMSP